MKSIKSFQLPSFFLPILAIALLALPTTLSAKQKLSGDLIFSNGDLISGAILSWNDEEIELLSPDMLESSTFSTKNILSLKLHDDPAARLPTPKDLTTLTLKPRNDKSLGQDEISGSLSQISDTHVTLDTPYAGTLKFKRSLVQDINIEATGEHIYQGPNSLSEWFNTEHNTSWKYSKGALISGDLSGAISQEFKLTNQIKISLDHSWKTNAYFKMKFYSSDHKMSNPEHSYELSVSYDRLSIIKKILS